jgi:hypothetical protein
MLEKAKITKPDKSTFQILTALDKACIFSCSSSKETDEWVNAIQRVINACNSEDSTSDDSDNEESTEELLQPVRTRLSATSLTSPFITASLAKPPKSKGKSSKLSGSGSLGASGSLGSSGSSSSDGSGSGKNEVQDVELPSLFHDTPTLVAPNLSKDQQDHISRQKEVRIFLFLHFTHKLIIDY